MAARNGTEGYGWVTRTLHWSTVLAVTAQFAVGYVMDADDSGRGRGRGRRGGGGGGGGRCGRGRRRLGAGPWPRAQRREWSGRRGLRLPRRPRDPADGPCRARVDDLG